MMTAMFKMTRARAKIPYSAEDVERMIRMRERNSKNMLTSVPMSTIDVPTAIFLRDSCTMSVMGE